MYLWRVPTTVLLVEDEVDLSDAVSIALRRAGHQVVVAGTGEEAIAAVEEQAFDAVVMDRGLPDADGAAVAAQMRAMGHAGAIVIVSGYGGQLHEETCRTSGADSVLLKPFRLAELVDVVQGLLGDRRMVAAATS